VDRDGAVRGRAERHPDRSLMGRGQPRPHRDRGSAALDARRPSGEAAIPPAKWAAFRPVLKRLCGERRGTLKKLLDRL
jgi:hypothetical protein